MNQAFTVMVVVLCQKQVLAVYEEIDDQLVLSFPKGLIEGNETLLETAIRITYETTNLRLTEANFVSMLTPLSYFNEPRLQVFPLLFSIEEKGNILPKGRRIKQAMFMSPSSFLKLCADQSIKQMLQVHLMIN